MGNSPRGEGGFWKMLEFCTSARGARVTKINGFPLKMKDFEQNDRILSLLDGPGGVYGGSCGLFGVYICIYTGIYVVREAQVAEFLEKLLESDRKNGFSFGRGGKPGGRTRPGAPKSMDFVGK